VDFAENFVFFAAAKKVCKSITNNQVIATVRVAAFLTDNVFTRKITNTTELNMLFIETFHRRGIGRV